MSARLMLVALGCGVAFGSGLALAGLTRPEAVVAFLDVGGRWDPTLGVVMVVATIVNATAVAAATRRPGPLRGSRGFVPAAGRIDRRLIGGAALFGIGWGLAGVCPGPALTSLASGDGSVLTFVTSMVAGLRLVDVVAPRARRHTEERSAS